MSRRRQPFGEWLLRRLVFGAIMLVIILILASFLPGLIESLFLRAIPETSPEVSP